VARQIGAAWHDLRQWRTRIESEVRGTFPNLPPTHEVAQAVRSPLAFLDRLADEHEQTLSAESGPGADDGGADASAAALDATQPSGNGTAPGNGSVPGNGSAPGETVAHNGSGGARPHLDAAAERAATVVPGAFPAVPDDPSMN
jgi:hypothetical protein